MAKLKLKREAAALPALMRRPLPFMIRLTTEERAEVDRMARAANVTRSELARCRIFGIPLRFVGGREPGVSRITKNGTFQTPPAA